jgi:hypothetical protein
MNPSVENTPMPARTSNEEFDHDAERDRQREEDVRICCEPDPRLSERCPVWGEEGVETIHGPWQEQAAHNERAKENHEQGNEDDVGPLKSFLHTGGEDEQRDRPYREEHPHDGSHKLNGRSRRLGQMQEVAHEEACRIVSPSEV